MWNSITHERTYFPVASICLKVGTSNKTAFKYIFWILPLTMQIVRCGIRKFFYGDPVLKGGWEVEYDLYSAEPYLVWGLVLLFLAYEYFVGSTGFRISSTPGYTRWTETRRAENVSVGRCAIGSYFPKRKRKPIRNWYFMTVFNT